GVGPYITAGFVFGFIVFPIRAGERIVRIKAVGRDVIAGQLDLALGKHRGGKQGFSSRIDHDPPLYIGGAARRWNLGQEHPEIGGGRQGRRNVAGGNNDGRFHLFDGGFVVPVSVHGVPLEIPAVGQVSPTVGRKVVDVIV